MFHPRVTAVARKISRSFCQKCRWQVTPKHAYVLDPTKSEWADYVAVHPYHYWPTKFIFNSVTTTATVAAAAAAAVATAISTIQFLCYWLLSRH